MKRLTFVKLVLFVFVSRMFSLELQTNDTKIIRVGVIDMDKIIDEHPFVRKTQQDILIFRENKNAEIATLEKEIESLLKQKLIIATEIEQLKTQLNTIEKSSSTDNVETSTSNIQLNQQIHSLMSTIETKQKNLDELNRIIEEKNALIKQKKQEIETEVEKMKQIAETTTYAELYKLIQQIAKQEGLNIIINKSGILYGEPELDITEKLIKKLKQ